MEIQEALDIVRKLANGVHPETGEMVTSDSMYQHPQAVRALHCVAGIFWLGQRPRAQKPASKKRRRIIATFTLFFSVLVCVSCGSGLQGNGGGSGSPGTPTGTYNITVTTTSGTVTHSTPVGLTVTP